MIKKKVIEIYPRLTVDPLVFAVVNEQLCILLYVRDKEPEKGKIAIPGGHSYANNSTRTSIGLALENKSNIRSEQLSYSEQMYFFDTQNIDPRGHAVTLAYLCCVRPGIARASYINGAMWQPISKIPKLAFDHISIVNKAIQELKTKLAQTNFAQFLLEKEFTLNQLFELYQMAFNTNLDNRNFRKRFIKLDVLEKTNRVQKGTPNRPSALYKFKNIELKNLYEIRF